MGARRRACAESRGQAVVCTRTDSSKRQRLIIPLTNDTTDDISTSVSGVVGRRVLQRGQRTCAHHLVAQIANIMR